MIVLRVSSDRNKCWLNVALPSSPPSKHGRLGCALPPSMSFGNLFWVAFVRVSASDSNVLELSDKSVTYQTGAGLFLSDHILTGWAAIIDRLLGHIEFISLSVFMFPRPHHPH